MKQLVLDGALLQSREQLHALAARELELPDYYGRNLDALHDCLCEQAEAVVIKVQNTELLKENLGRYAKALLRMLSTAAEQNPHVTLKLETVPAAQ